MLEERFGSLSTTNSVHRTPLGKRARGSRGKSGSGGGGGGARPFRQRRQGSGGRGPYRQGGGARLRGGREPGGRRVDSAQFSSVRPRPRLEDSASADSNSLELNPNMDGLGMNGSDRTDNGTFWV